MAVKSHFEFEGVAVMDADRAVGDSKKSEFWRHQHAGKFIATFPASLLH